MCFLFPSQNPGAGLHTLPCVCENYTFHLDSCPCLLWVQTQSLLLVVSSIWSILVVSSGSWCRCESFVISVPWLFFLIIFPLVCSHGVFHMSPDAHGLHFDDSASSASGGTGFDLNIWRSAFKGTTGILGNHMYSYTSMHWQGMTLLRFFSIVSLSLNMFTSMLFFWANVLVTGIQVVVAGRLSEALALTNDSDTLHWQVLSDSESMCLWSWTLKTFEYFVVIVRSSSCSRRCMYYTKSESM